MNGRSEKRAPPGKSSAWAQDVEKEHGARSEWADAVHIFSVIGRGLHPDMINAELDPPPSSELGHGAPGGTAGPFPTLPAPGTSWCTACSGSSSVFGSHYH